MHRNATSFKKETYSGMRPEFLGYGVLVLGLGKTFCGDEGAAVHVARLLAADQRTPKCITLVDIGTLGLSLMETL